MLNEVKATKPIEQIDDPFFDNLKGWLRPKEVADAFGISVWTIYTWKHREKQFGVPEGLFVKFGRGLFIRTNVLRQWIASQNQAEKAPLNI